MSTASSTITKARIQKWRNNLLDMTRRNRLLYFKASGTGTFPLQVRPEDLFATLVADDEAIGFPELDTPEEEDARFSFLNKMRLKTQATLKEQGVQTLYVVLGFLKWKETAGSQETIVSPLLLVPVELVRERGSREFHLERSASDELVSNPTLARKLDGDFRLSLPEFAQGDEVGEDEDGSSYGTYLARVRQAIAKNEGWSVEERSCLAVFNFAKLAMFKDMEQFEEEMAGHEVVRALSGDKGSRMAEPSDVVAAKHIDTTIRPQDQLMVLDADSSQQEAILLARQGQSFVLQGPPGTGKSQTITNIIAELIGMGRSVLFVSEKMAALDVVRKRLVDCGLGDFCLEMHSNKSQKKEVIAELQRTLQLALQGTGRAAPKFQFEDLRIARDRLNAYVNELHIVRPLLEKSAFQVYAELAKLDGVPELSFAFPDVLNVEEHKLRDIGRLLHELEAYAEELVAGNGHPWAWAIPTAYTHTLASDIRINFKGAANFASSLAATGAELAEALGHASPPGRTASLPQRTIARHLLAAPGQILGDWLVPGAPEYVTATMSNARDSLETLAAQRQALLHKASDSILSLDLDGALAALEDGAVRDLALLQRPSGTDEQPEADALDRLVGAQPTLIIAFGQVLQGREKLVAQSGLAQSVGVGSPETVADWQVLARLARHLNKSPAPPRRWFLEGTLLRLRPLASQGAAACGDYHKSRSELLRNYGEAVLTSDVAAIEQVFMSHAPALATLKGAEDPLATLDAKRLQLGSLLSGMTEVSATIDEAATKVTDLTGLGAPRNLSELRKMCDLLEAGLQTPRPLPAWMVAEDAERVVRQLGKHMKALEALQSQRAALNERYLDDVFDTDIETLYQRFLHDYAGFTRLFKPSYYRDLGVLKRLSAGPRKLSSEVARNDLRALRDFKREDATLRDEEGRLGNQLERYYEAQETDWDNALRVASWAAGFAARFPEGSVPDRLAALLTGPAAGLTNLREVVRTLREGCTQLGALMTELSALSDFPVLYRPGSTSEDMPLSSAITTAGQLQAMLQACGQAIDGIRVHQHGGQRPIAELRDDLQKIKAVQGARLHVEAKGVQLAADFGGFYTGLETDWAKLTAALDWCEGLEAIFAGSVPEAVAARAEQCVETELERCAGEIEQALVQLEQGHQRLSNHFNLSAEGFSFDLAGVKPTMLAAWVERASGVASGFWDTRDRVVACLPAGGASAKEVVHLRTVLEEARQFLRSEEAVVANSGSWKLAIGARFDGLETDWEALSEALGWCAELLRLAGSDRTPQVIALATAEAAVREPLRAWSDQLQKLDAAFDAKWAYVASIFPPAILAPDGHDRPGQDLRGTADWLLEKIDALPGLERFLHCKDVLQRCEEMGVKAFTTALVAAPQLVGSGASFERVFLRRFYQHWMDAIASRAPMLASFQGKDHERLIQEFAKLDEGSIEVNQGRIQANLRASLGASLGQTMSYEIETLSRQATSKRQWALRKLIGSTRPLLTKIKPCWLMSPLSVSQFLETAPKMFDVIVFDEASQMPTEDAIGAIYRGAQLIVVGDRHQLPPTRFFASSDGLDDDEDEETEVFESVLDEAMGCMPSRMLLWHYRSRHEALIAFSNRHFYDNRLFTFPSALYGDGAGVSFVHVEDGVYENRTNRNEARRVAQLVFEHFDEHPTRSLGVIAFSEAQQMMIVDEIERLRKVRPVYEPFFDEGRPDTFFVKNLENVQGDERDSIIFSVCYAKDPAGKMAYRFGPLIRAGGERRLNVAVTRARHQVKLVSSIRASEMDPASCKSKGAQLLRSYIDYAERGMNAIVDAVTVDEHRFDSPFEEEVFAALTARGLQLHTQVGCSGYRIDLAVQDPEMPGRYRLGIECDGAAYHSAATARDRDRLRQQLLERLGWKIHRIWSRDWINNRENELEKVMAACPTSR